MFKGKSRQNGRLDDFVAKLPAINWKIAIGVPAATALWLFGDVLLPTLGHALHVLLEMVESLLDDFFTEVAGLSHHGAEIATAYTGLVVALYVLVKLLRKGYALTLQAWASLLALYSNLRKSPQARWMEQHWPILATGAGVVTLVYLLMF